MKISTLILIFIAISLVAIFAFHLGSLFERMANVQTGVGELKVRVSDLEEANSRRDLRWEWVKRIGSHLPIVGKHIG